MSIRKSLPLWLRIGAPVLITLILAFVLLPVVVVMLASFNDKALLTFPPQAWSWRWFERVFTYADFRVAHAGSGNLEEGGFDVHGPL